MLKTQEYLKKNSLEKLIKDYALEATYSPVGESLVILNYSQIDSPKHSPITKECRGLVLNTQTYEVVAKGFSRFFNYGESREEINNFNWKNFSTQNKEDGSLIIFYWYEDLWFVNTRASFGLGKVGNSNFTWEELFYQTINEKSIDY
jgi:tRNA splicing ligase